MCRALGMAGAGRSKRHLHQAVGSVSFVPFRGNFWLRFFGPIRYQSNHLIECAEAICLTDMTVPAGKYTESHRRTGVLLFGQRLIYIASEVETFLVLNLNCRIVDTSYIAFVETTLERAPLSPGETIFHQVLHDARLHVCALDLGLVHLPASAAEAGGLSSSFAASQPSA